MLGEEIFDGTNPDEARDIGSKRFASMSIFDAPVFVPPDPLWAASIIDEVRRQVASCKDVEILLSSYIELLKQSKALVDFWQNNVGPTEDWPISVIGESEEVEACLTRRFEKLKLAVNFIEESHCS